MKNNIPRPPRRIHALESRTNPVLPPNLTNLQNLGGQNNLRANCLFSPLTPAGKTSEAKMKRMQYFEEKWSPHFATKAEILPMHYFGMNQSRNQM